MSTPTLSEKLRYEIDNILAKGTGALIGVLAIASIAVIVVSAIIVAIFQLSPDLTFSQVTWMALLRTLDSGTMGGDQGSYGFLFMMLLVTIGGIFIVSALIGVINSGLEARLETMRKGKSRVVEADHTVILGWSEQIYTVVSELIIANASKPRAVLVIMADKDATEMYELLEDHVPTRDTTRIVCRSGSTMEPTALATANLQASKAIIVLRPEGDNPDIHVIKTLLAIVNDPQRRSAPYHIVAEINDPKNVAVARIVGRDEVELIVTGEMIARITAQTCRQSGLSTIYTELLDFGGDEMYFRHDPVVVGKSFGDVLLHYPTSTVIGIVPNGKPAELNPPHDRLLTEEDALVFIAADDSAIVYTDEPIAMANEEAFSAAQIADAKPEHTLILGWNWRTPLVIRELDSYVAAGSSITLVSPYQTEDISEWYDVYAPVNATVSVRNDDTTDRDFLDDLDLLAYHHIIVMAASEALEAEEADARTLITLLHLRDISDRIGHPFSIVSEMLDVRNRRLAEVTKADDFIVSNRLISLILAQVTENKGLNAVFTDLFDPEGAEVYLKPVNEYITPGHEVNTATIVAAARNKGEVALGYRIAADSGNADKAYGVVINPSKDRLRTFSAADRIIVLANQ